MWDLIVMALSKLRKQPEPMQFLDTVIYRRTQNIASLNEVLDISLVISQNPVNHNNVQVPGGAFISQRQYKLLPAHLRAYFTQETVRLKVGA